jgi:type I restriction enzyme S subunit
VSRFGWVCTTIGQIANISSGFGFPNRFQGKTTGDFPFAKVRDISNAVKNASGRLVSADNYVDHSDLKALRARPVPAGSTAFAKIGEALRLNRRAILGVDTILDNNCMAVSPDLRVAEPEFVYRFLTTVDLSPFAVATTVPSVRRGDVEGIFLSLPPLHEQRRIVAKIGSLTQKSRRARDQLDRVPRLVEKYKQAICAAVFSEASAISAPGEFSRVILSTFYGPRFAKTDYIQGGVVTLRTTDFDDGGNVRPKSPPSVRVSERDFLKWGLIDGDLLVTRTGSIGKCALYSEEIGPALPSAYLIRVRLNLELIRPRYALLFLLSTQGQRQLGLGITAVTQPNINAGVIERVGLPIPGLELQDRMVHRIDQAFAWIERLASEAASARRLIDHFDETVLTKAFQGELVPQDPNDEPASVLLERIKAERKVHAQSGAKKAFIRAPNGRGADEKAGGRYD